MKRVFCWLPTPVYSRPYWRDGFRWLRFVWRANDGTHYADAAEPNRYAARIRFAACVLACGAFWALFAHVILKAFGG